MKIEDLNKKKVPIFKIDKSLNHFNDKILFPDKLEKANNTLSVVGLPDLT